MTRFWFIIACFLWLVSCEQRQQSDGVFAPQIDPKGNGVDALVVGERLMNAGEYQLALDAFVRAAGTQGFTPEILSAMGVANYRLGRIDQSLSLFKRALDQEPEWAGLLNNYGTVLMASGDYAQAVEVFKKAVALDNGENDSIRKNLAQAVEKYETSLYSQANRKKQDVAPQGLLIVNDHNFP